jgi:O-antigen/teichoic acid export membrane protein
VKLTQYFKNLSLLFFINFAVKPIWVFAIERKFQLTLGKEAYGQYFEFLYLVYIFALVLDLGLHNFTVKSISEWKENYKNYTAELWISKGVLSALFISIVIIYLLTQTNSWEQRLIFFLVAIEMLAFSLYQFLRSFVQGLQLLKLDSFLSSFDRIMLILFGGGILLLAHDDLQISIYHFICFHIAAYLFCFLVVGFMLRKKLSFSIDTYSPSQLIEIIRKGWPLIIIVLFMTIYSRIDVVLLGKMLPNGAEQCDILALSLRIIDSAFNVLALLSVFLLPTVAYHYSEGNLTYVKKVVLISFGISTLLSLGLIFVSLVFGDLIYDKLYPEHTAYDLAVFKQQVWCVLGVGWMFVFGSYLTATERYKELIAIVAIGVILSLVSNFYFIPQYEAMGVAMTSSFVQLTMGMLHLVVAFYYLFRTNKA